MSDLKKKASFYISVCLHISVLRSLIGGIIIPQKTSSRQQVKANQGTTADVKPTERLRRNQHEIAWAVVFID